MALKTRMRLYEGKDFNRFFNSTKNIPNQILHSKAKLLTIDMNGLSTSSASEIDGLTAKMQKDSGLTLEFVSASVHDHNLGGTGFAEKIQAIVVGTDNEPRNIVKALQGTTPVETTSGYKDVWHSQAIEWGSAGDTCSGNVDIRRKSDDTVYCRIAAGANEGQGSCFKIPENWRGALLNGYLQSDQNSGLAAGTQLKMYINDPVDQLTTTNVLNWNIAEVYKSSRRQVMSYSKVLEAETEVSFFQQQIGAAADFCAHLEFLLWKK